MFDDASSEYKPAPDSDADSTTKVNADLIDEVYARLDSMGYMAFDSNIGEELIRRVARLPEPVVDGLSPREIHRAFTADDLKMLALRDGIFERHLMHQGMALRKNGEQWRVPSKREMPKIWKQYADRASNALRRAQWLIKAAPSTSGEDAAFAQMQAARVARRVAQLTEQAARMQH